MKRREIKEVPCPLCGKDWATHSEMCEGMKSPTAPPVIGHSVKNVVEGK